MIEVSKQGNEFNDQVYFQIQLARYRHDEMKYRTSEEGRGIWK